ncbi:hypothetical protein PLICRDRAFT_304125 [Plicaturopsis crispa FD-325 SS-3]|nr:hypothetical protein PLICRDRAFT_304125 [Plicaturopsis crispa FD-325 SS-3]
MHAARGLRELQASTVLARPRLICMCHNLSSTREELLGYRCRCRPVHFLISQQCLSLIVCLSSTFPTADIHFLLPEFRKIAI